MTSEKASTAELEALLEEVRAESRDTQERHDEEMGADRRQLDEDIRAMEARHGEVVRTKRARHAEHVRRAEQRTQDIKARLLQRREQDLAAAAHRAHHEQQKLIAIERQAREARARIREAKDSLAGLERLVLHDQRRQRSSHDLTGIAAVQGAFYFLRDSADVLNAATACRRWGELACADSVWRTKFRREGLLGKARAFEIALPPPPPPPPPPPTGGSDGGGGGHSAPTAEGEADTDDDEAAGVGLVFYAQVFVLKVQLSNTHARRQ